MTCGLPGWDDQNLWPAWMGWPVSVVFVTGISVNLLIIVLYESLVLCIAICVCKVFI